MKTVIARMAADLGAFLRFFSRLPVPRLSALDDPAAAPRFAEAAGLIALAGPVIAAPAALLAALLAGTGLPPLAAGAFVVAVEALVTGFLHEDGLADTADGLGGGRDREHRLAIMKDSRIGAFGAASLCLVLFARASLVAALLGLGGLAAAGALLAAAAASRAAMVGVWHLMPPARSDGLSAGAGRPQARPAAVALAVGAGAALLALGVGGTGGVLAAIAAALAGAAIPALLARRLIGGQTGDILGAVQQAAATGFLAGLFLPA